MTTDPRFSKARRRNSVFIAIGLAAVALSAYVLSALRILNHGLD